MNFSIASTVEVKASKMAWYAFILILSCSCIIGIVLADPCESRDSCSKCITSSKCVWCAKANFAGSRCKSSNSDIRDQCPGEVLDIHSKTEIIKNDAFTSSIDNVVQIAPQRIKIKLKVNEPTPFSFKYKQAQNYPVDLYFLLDVSKTMQKIRDSLMKQSRDIYNVMRTFTTNIRIGIGTFVDKGIFPYKKPQVKECYSFRNELSLTETNINDNTFYDKLNATKFYENYDSPEGGLDALAQVLVCNNIGWKSHSRKIILFITDDEYHQAGDGIVAGIRQPYDGKCYMESDYVYTKELKMDYPSVPMIRKLAAQKEAIIIFVARDNMDNVYDNLAAAVDGKFESYSVQETTENAKFDKIIKEIYETKTKIIKLKVKKKKAGDNLNIAFTPNCLDGDEYESCTVQEYNEKEINGILTLYKFEETVKTYEVEIQIDGLYEKIVLDIEVITDCECGSVNEAPECNNNGNLECGLCTCGKKWFGPYCNCTEEYDTTDNSASCKQKETENVCSGNGDCKCGACECHRDGNGQTYTGQYCQCSSDSCPRGNDEICSGHGHCDCGYCFCESLRSGMACEISLENTNCMKNNKECSGKGFCYNNNCQCDKLPDWDERKNSLDPFCVIKPNTDVHKQQCKTLEDWAICAHEKKEQCTVKDDVKINIVTKINEGDNLLKICEEVRVGVGCYISFGYKYHDENRTIELFVENKENCLETHYMVGGIVVATLIFVGLCTLIGWKVVTTIQDRREYSQFLISCERKVSIRKNITYKSPNSTIDNPTYVKNSSDSLEHSQKVDTVAPIEN